MRELERLHDKQAIAMADAFMLEPEESEEVDEETTNFYINGMADFVMQIDQFPEKVIAYTFSNFRSVDGITDFVQRDLQGESMNDPEVPQKLATLLMGCHEKFRKYKHKAEMRRART